MSNFFTENYNNFEKFAEAIEVYEVKSEAEKRLIELLKAAYKAAMFNREEYDHLTPYSAERQGKALLQAIVSPLTQEKLERALLFFAGFIREASLVRENRSQSEQIVLDHFLGSEGEISGDEWGGYHSDYLRYVLPSKLLETTYRGISRVREDIKKIGDEAEEGAAQLEARINGYRGELEKISSEYNFVGLSYAFRKMLEAKQIERRFGFISMILLGAIAVVIPSYFLIESGTSSLSSFIPTTWSPQL